MSLLDVSEPVVKAPGDDERESGLSASQNALQDKSPGAHHSIHLCPLGETGAANSSHPDAMAEVDLKVSTRSRESLNMETENDTLDVSRKNVSNAGLLKAPCFDNDGNGFVHQAFCTDAKLIVSQKRDGDGASNRDADENRFQDSSEIKSTERDKCTNYGGDKNGFEDLKEERKGEATDYEKKNNKVISPDDKEAFGEADLEKELSNQPVSCPENLNQINPNNTVIKCFKSDATHKNLTSPEKISIENKTKEKEKTSDKEIGVPEEDEDTICGLGSFRPKWLQKWATPRCYLILYSIIGVFQGGYYAYLIGTISTLEKRFAFKSKISGVIMIIDEITPLVLGIFVGYFGGKAHRPRMVALGMFLSTLCCFSSAMPFFIYGTAQHLVYRNSTSAEVCDLEQKGEQCAEDDRPPTLAAVVFLILGSFLKGFGNLAYYAIGLSYMDDNARKKNTPVYLGISFALRLLGPTLGFLMSSAFLKIYENPFKDPGFGREDPRWIGAWWLGFVVQGVLLLISTFPIMLFPRRLPKQRKSNPKSQSSFEHEGAIQKAKGLLVGLKRLSTNEVYVFQAIGNVLNIIGAFGHYVLLPKYMENQFRLSASDASLYAGPPGLVAHQVSSILGSIIIWKYLLSARTILTGKIITETLGVIIVLLMMIPSCPNISFADSRQVDILGKGVELENECNKNCQCTTNVFTPMCGPDGVSTYFSSCHAGCSVALPKDIYGPEVFGNCSCVLGMNGSFINVEEMKKGFCPDEDCWTQAKIYITLLPTLDAITSIFRVGHTMILLRSVDPQDKSFALGTFETVICLFGFIPYPIIFGALVDSACLIWEFSCGVSGNCWVYDMQKFNFMVHGVSAAFCLASVICDMRVLSLSHKIRDLYKEDDGDDDDGDEEKHDKSGEKLPDNTVKSTCEGNIACTRL